MRNLGDNARQIFPGRQIEVNDCRACGCNLIAQACGQRVNQSAFNPGRCYHEVTLLPDSALLAYYVLRRMTRLLDGLQVFPQRMLDNLSASHGLVFSQPVLLGLVKAGMSRDEAYRIVQENSARAWAEGCSFRELLDADPRIKVPTAVLDDAFDLARSVRHSGRGLDALATIEMP